MAEIVINDFGGAPYAKHNMPCAVCGKKKAVFEINYGRFQPCWECQDAGWRTVRFNGWFGRLLRSLGFGEGATYGPIVSAGMDCVKTEKS